MSAITENPSIVSRGRASSRYLRSYQKVSEANLDDRAVVTYLKKHHLHRTITTFMAESHFQNHIQPIIQIIQRGGAYYQGQVSEIVNHIKTQTLKRQSTSSHKLLTVELFLHIWFCIEGEHLNKSRIHVLRQYINQKGQKLSQIPELLPYFALPYASEPNSHHFLQKIFKSEWKEQLKTMIMQLVGKKSEQKKEEEWLNIVEDMVQICTQLFKHIDVNKKDNVLESMAERVNLYKYVIDKNKKQHEKASQSRANQTNIKDIQQLESYLTSLADHLQKAKIFHKLQLEIIALEQFKQDKQYVLQIIRFDLLDLKHRTIETLDFEQTKLIQMISSYHQGRNYLERYPALISHFINTIENIHNQKHISKQELLLLECVLDTVSKLVIRKTVFKYILKINGSISLFLSVFEKFKKNYIKGSQAIEPVLLVVANLLTNLVMHRQGRQIIAKTMYFESLISFMNKMTKQPLNLHLQKTICSSIYLLLVNQGIRRQAKKLRVKDLLLESMSTIHSEGYETIVGFIIERIQTDGDIQDGDSDQDQEKSVQFDSNIRVKADIVYHKGQIVNLKEDGPKKSIVQQSSLEKDRTKSRSKRSLHQPTQSRPYFRDKYVRKSQQPRQGH